MKPERQAEVDSIPPVHLNYYRFFVIGNDLTEIQFWYTAVCQRMLRKDINAGIY